VSVVADGVLSTRNDVGTEGATPAEKAIDELDSRRRTEDAEGRKVARVQVEPEQGEAREIDDVI
jgi:hypothetical protein